MKYTKLVIGIIIGVIIAGTSVYYAATIYYDSINVGYDNTVSGLDSTNVQDALDELCNLPDLSDRVSNLEQLGNNWTKSSTSNDKLQVNNLFFIQIGTLTCISGTITTNTINAGEEIAHGFPGAEITNATPIEAKGTDATVYVSFWIDYNGHLKAPTAIASNKSINLAGCYKSK